MVGMARKVGAAWQRRVVCAVGDVGQIVRGRVDDVDRRWDFADGHGRKCVRVSWVSSGLRAEGHPHHHSFIHYYICKYLHISYFCSILTSKYCHITHY